MKKQAKFGNLWSLLVLLRTAVQAAPAAEQSPSYYVAPYSQGTGVSAAFNKAKSFVAEMTLEEKLNLTVWGFSVPRLGFYGFNASDGSNGPATTFSTPHDAFENSITLAASLDKNLMYERAYLTGVELRKKGYNVLFGPNGNMMRSPQAGRNPENYGPEPYLTGIALAEFVKGLQDAGTIAITKHFIGNEQEHARFLESSDIDDKTLHEVYAWPFADAVRAGTLGIMCSYQKVNSTYACANPETMGDLLKGRLDYQGFIVSDFQADRVGMPAFRNGLDTQLGISTLPTPGQLFRDYGGYLLGQNLTTDVNAGLVPMARVDDAAVRQMTAYFQLKQDKIDFPSLPNNISVNSTTARDHIRKAGAASAVLLKNTNNALPLKSPANLVLFGMDAQTGPGGPNLPGNGLQVAPDVFIALHAPTGANTTGHIASQWGTDLFPYLVDPYTALKAKAQADGSSFAYVRDPYDMEAITAAASTADATCLAFLLSNSGEETDSFETNFGDRNNITAWFNGDNVVNAVVSQCANTIIVVNAVGPITMPWADHPNVTAIVFAGLPGQESGNSLVDVLYGAYNPSAKLPFTIAHNVSDYPAQVDFSIDDFTPHNVSIAYTEGVFLDYRHFDEINYDPVFPFMHGLSYTNFTYSRANVQRTGGNSRRWHTPGGTAEWYEIVRRVSVTVKNSGSVAGNATPQLYVGFPAGTGEPPKVMRGFNKVYLKPGQSETVTFELRRKDISIWDVSRQDFVVPSGKITAYIGESSRNIVAEVSL